MEASNVPTCQIIVKMDYQQILEDIYKEILPYAGKGSQAALFKDP